MSKNKRKLKIRLLVGGFSTSPKILNINHSSFDLDLRPRHKGFRFTIRKKTGHSLNPWK